jgi:hypothetical protein
MVVLLLVLKCTVHGFLRAEFRIAECFSRRSMNERRTLPVEHKEPVKEQDHILNWYGVALLQAS